MYCGKPVSFLQRKFLNRWILLILKTMDYPPSVKSYAGQAANLANDSSLALDINANNWIRDSAPPPVQPPQPSVAMAKKLASTRPCYRCNSWSTPFRGEGSDNLFEPRVAAK